MKWGSIRTLSSGWSGSHPHQLFTDHGIDGIDQLLHGSLWLATARVGRWLMETSLTTDKSGENDGLFGSDLETAEGCWRFNLKRRGANGRETVSGLTMP